MSRRTSFTAGRRARLARRVESLEAMEARSMITESLGILTLGIGIPHAPAALRPADRPSRTPAAVSFHARTFPALVGISAPHPVAAASPARSAPVRVAAAVATHAPARSGDWLTLASRSPTHAAVTVHRPFTPSAAAPQAGGGVAGSSHGGGGNSPAAAAITPLNLAPPQAANPSPAFAPVVTSTSPTATSPARMTVSHASASAAPTPSPTPSGGSSLAHSGGALSPQSGGGARSFSSPQAFGQFTNFPLYTLDNNDGTVLFPGGEQEATLAGFVDLRAQVRDTTVASYSWDTTHLTDVKYGSITGTTTPRLQFEWTNNIPTATTDSVTLTVTNNLNQTEVQTYTFALPVGSVSYPSGGGGGSVTWPETLAPDLNLPGSPAFATHNAAIDANTGAAQTLIALPSYNANVPAVALSYDSQAAAPQPAVVEHHTLDPAQAAPSQVSAQLTLNGTAGTTYYYNTSQFIPGDVQQIALQASATTLATGRYAYSYAIGDIRGATTTTNPSGTLTVLNRASSPIGAGWTVAGLEQITTATGGVILDVGQGDSSLWFSGGGGSGGVVYQPSGGLLDAGQELQRDLHPHAHRRHGAQLQRERAGDVARHPHRFDDVVRLHERGVDDDHRPVCQGHDLRVQFGRAGDDH